MLNRIKTEFNVRKQKNFMKAWLFLAILFQFSCKSETVHLQNEYANIIHGLNTQSFHSYDKVIDTLNQVTTQIYKAIEHSSTNAREQLFVLRNEVSEKLDLIQTEADYYQQLEEDNDKYILLLNLVRFEHHNWILNTGKSKFESKKKEILQELKRFYIKRSDNIVLSESVLNQLERYLENKLFSFNEIREIEKIGNQFVKSKINTKIKNLENLAKNHGKKNEIIQYLKNLLAVSDEIEKIYIRDARIKLKKIFLDLKLNDQDLIREIKRKAIKQHSLNTSSFENYGIIYSVDKKLFKTLEIIPNNFEEEDKKNKHFAFANREEINIMTPLKVPIKKRFSQDIVEVEVIVVYTVSCDENYLPKTIEYKVLSEDDVP